MFSNSHWRLTESSALGFILCRNGISVSAKHVLEKIAFHRQLTDGLQHTNALLLQLSLLFADFILG